MWIVWRKTQADMVEIRSENFNVVNEVPLCFEKFTKF